MSASMASAPAQPVTTGLSTRELAVAYIGALLVTVMPVLAAGALVIGERPAVPLAVAGAVGLPASMVFRRWRVPRLLLNAMVVIVSGVLVVRFLVTTPLGAILAGAPMWRVLLSTDSAQGYQMLIHIFLIFLAVRSFSLVGNRDLVLTIVPALSTLLLIATVLGDLSLLPFFIPFALGCLLLLLFSHRQGRGRDCLLLSEPARQRRGLLFNLRSLAVIVMLSVLFSGSLMFVFRGGIDQPAWLESLGGALVQRMARAFIEASRTSYTSYSLALHLRGRSFPVSRRELFRVTARRPARWRGSVFESYTGQGWSHRRLQRRSYPVRGGITTVEPLDEGLRAGVEAERLVQSFRLIVHQQGILYGAYEPETFRFPGGEVHAVRVDIDSALQVSTVLDPDVEYTVESLVKAPPDPARVGRRPPPPWIRDRYLAMPDTVPERVRELGRGFAGAHDHPLRIAESICAYLSQRLQYTTDPPVIPWRRDGRLVDCVEYVLFESRQGFCTHFASAFAVLCRLAGVPSRVVTGYAPGEWDPASGEFIVREKDAHAWAEIYLSDYGWYEMEPSAQIDLDAIADEMSAPAIDRKVSLVERLRALFAAMGSTRSRRWLLGGLAAVALIGVTALVRRRRASLRWWWRRWSPGPQQGEAGRCWLRARKALSRAFRPPRRAETVLEYVSAVDAWMGRRCDPLHTIADRWVRTLYAATAPPAGGDSRQLLDALRRQVRSARQGAADAAAR